MKEDMEHIELRISRFLRLGVMIAGLLIAIGWVFNLKLSGDLFSQFKTYDPIPLQNFWLYHYNQGNWSRLLCYVGLFSLISLPVIRVILTGILFFKQKDFLLAFFAGLVFLGLIISFSFGFQH
ncbi:MAG TPA: DUF1634 domain-containing protein [Bacteriovoracaceae bacterium]|nr:DUF1634 domain-containing protein [Bacteriovoracaceae bacterium]